MKLNIENFAKIKNADIVVDGITVIAGENNTGKSTVGKILFSLFNVLSDIDEKINEERLREIESTNRITMLVMFDSTRGLALQKAMYYTRRIKKRIRKQLENDRYVDDEKLYEIINTVFDEEKKNASISDKNNWSEIAMEVYKNTKEILQLPEKTIILEAISRYFNNVFHSQMQNNCKECTGEINIVHKAIYIDNPFVIDELSKDNELDPMNQMIENLLVTSYREETIEGIIETVRAKEKLADLFEMLQNVVEGDIVMDQKDEFYLRTYQFSEHNNFL